MPASRWGLVIFDHDGVLVDSEILSMQILTGLLAQHRVHLTVDEVLDRFVGARWDEIMDACAIDPQLRRALQAEYHAELFTRFETELVPVPGMPDLLAGLNRAGIPIAVGSAASGRRVALGIGSTGLVDHFPPDLVLSRDEVARPKPAPDVFLLAAARAGVPAAKCIVVDDSRQGVEAAKAAGMAVIGFTHRTAENRLAAADWLAPDVPTLRAMLLGAG